MTWLRIDAQKLLSELLLRRPGNIQVAKIELNEIKVIPKGLKLVTGGSCGGDKNISGAGTDGGNKGSDKDLRQQKDVLV